MDIFNKGELEKKEREIKERKNEIEQLKEVEERLKNKAENEEERAKNAITEKQRVYKKLNKAKDKIRTLEDKLDRKKVEKSQNEDGTEYRAMEFQKGVRILENLDSFEGTSKEFLTICNSSEDSLEGLKDFEKLKDKIPYQLFEILSKKGEDRNYIYVHSPYIFDLYLEVPFIKKSYWDLDSSFRVSEVIEDLKKGIGLISLNSGGSGICVAENGEIKRKEIIKSDIKSKHSKGGYSQRRFERLRENQIEEHRKEVEESIGKFFKDNIDVLIISGNRSIINKLGLDSIEARKFNKKVDIGKIKEEKGLKQFVKKALTFRLFHVNLP